MCEEATPQLKLVESKLKQKNVSRHVEIRNNLGKKADVKLQSHKIRQEEQVSP